jgi:hypothetical protein
MAKIRFQDAEALETDKVKRARGLMQLESIGKLRRHLAKKGVEGDSLSTLTGLREDRLERLSG